MQTRIDECRKSAGRSFSHAVSSVMGEPNFVGNIINKDPYDLLVHFVICGLQKFLNCAQSLCSFMNF